MDESLVLCDNPEIRGDCGEDIAEASRFGDAEYKNITLQKEHVAEFSYQPSKCNRPYRVIVLRKKLLVEQGQILLCDDVRSFFYITNI